MPEKVDSQPARDRLLAVATRLFIAQGFNGTPVSRIVREAKVTMPVLYYHFGNKVELLKAVIAGRGAWIRDDLRIDPDADFPENCRAMLNHALEHLPELRDGLRLRLVLGFETGPETADLRRHVQEQRRNSLAILAALFQSSLPAATERRANWLAEVYLSGVQGLALELIGGFDADLLKAKSDTLFRTLITTSELAEVDLPPST